MHNQTQTLVDVFTTPRCMEETSVLTIPRLCVRVTCVNGLGGLGGLGVLGGLPGGPGVRSYGEGFHTHLLPSQVVLANVSSPPLQLPAASMLLSAVHPTAGGCTHSFTADEGVWYLPAQNVALLRSAAHPLAVLVPGLRLQVHCPNPQDAEAAPGAHLGYSHLASFSVPLAACLKEIMAKNVCCVQRETCEDGMRYQMDVALDTRGLSLAGLQQVASEMQKGLDQLHHHQSLMARALGEPLRTVEELVAEASALRQRRTEACQRVLEAVSPDTKCNFNLNLQYGRAFGMQVDQQQCRALREGSVLSHGFEQTLLHLTVAQASFVAKLAQEADLALQSSLAVEHHISAQAPSTLWHGTMQQVQLAFTTRTKYHSDPSFGPTLKVAQAMRNDDGSMTVRVVPTFGLIKGPGEDQNLTPGTTYADVAPDARAGGAVAGSGGIAGGARWQGGATVFGGPAGPAAGAGAFLNLRDCEDGAMHINACNDVLRMHALEVVLAQQADILHMLPEDVQALGGGILKLTEVLHAHVNASAPPPSTLELAQLTAQTFTDALAKARAAPPRAQLYSTSLLASAPQLASAPLAGGSSDPSAKLGCCAKEYNAWWTGALMQGDKQANLNGHAVAIAVGLSPVLRTRVQDTPVDVHLIDPSLKIFESTAPAWQTEQADTALVKLNLKKEPFTPIRLKLQNDLDRCAPLTMCMACNVRSALHTAETRQVIATALDRKLQTGDAMAPATARLDAGSLPSMIPLQTFSLRAQADSEQELGRQLAFKFYKTLLAVGDGSVYSLDQHESAVSVYAGASMARELPGTASVVVGSPLSPAERRALHALGALQSSFLLSAAETLASMPPLMPLALQQRMKFCPDGQLVPLSGSELRSAAHACGMLAQTPLLPVTRASGAQGILENLTAMVSMAKQVVGPGLHVTGAPFADGLFLTFS